LVTRQRTHSTAQRRAWHTRACKPSSLEVMRLLTSRNKPNQRQRCQTAAPPPPKWVQEYKNRFVVPTVYLLSFHEFQETISFSFGFIKRLDIFVPTLHHFIVTSTLNALYGLLLFHNSYQEKGKMWERTPKAKIAPRL
jgi:hypothetical protein